MKVWIVIGVIVAAVYGIAHANSSSKSSSGSTTVSSTPRITVVKAHSGCFFSGIDDVYTGDGQVEFAVTLHNSGASSATVDVTPVRHYDDGELNESGMDTLVDITVPAYGSKAVRSPLYTYSAHKHEITGCGVMVGSGPEVQVSAKHG